MWQRRFWQVKAALYIVMTYASKCILKSQKVVHVNVSSITFSSQNHKKTPFIWFPLIHCVYMYTIKSKEQVECFCVWKNPKLAFSGTSCEQLWFLFLNTMLPDEHYQLLTWNLADCLLQHCAKKISILVPKHTSVEVKIKLIFWFQKKLSLYLFKVIINHMRIHVPSIGFLAHS